MFFGSLLCSVEDSERAFALWRWWWLIHFKSSEVRLIQHCPESSLKPRWWLAVTGSCSYQRFLFSLPPFGSWMATDTWACCRLCSPFRVTLNLLSKNNAAQLFQSSWWSRPVTGVLLPKGPANLAVHRRTPSKAPQAHTRGKERCKRTFFLFTWS